MTQQGDVLLYQTNDDGDLTVENGLVLMSGGLETAAYLSLFGGNEQDDGRQDSRLQYWGNIGEQPERQYRSETQYLLRSLAAIPVNLRRVEEAVVRDLAWFTAEKVATAVKAEASIPALNQIKIVITIEADGQPSVIEFYENWKAEI